MSGLNDLRAAVRVARQARNQDCYGPVARYGPWGEPEDAGEDAAIAERDVPTLISSMLS